MSPDLTASSERSFCRNSPDGSDRASARMLKFSAMAVTNHEREREGFVLYRVRVILQSEIGRGFYGNDIEGGDACVGREEGNN